MVGAGVKVRVPAPAPCYGSTLDKTEEILNDILVVNKYTIKVDSRLGYIPLILYYNKQRNTILDYMHTLYKEDPRNRFARWRILYRKFADSPCRHRGAAGGDELRSGRRC